MPGVAINVHEMLRDLKDPRTSPTDEMLAGKQQAGGTVVSG